MARKWGPKKCIQCLKLKPRTLQYFARRPGFNQYRPKCLQCCAKPRPIGRATLNLARLANRYRPSDQSAYVGQHSDWRAPIYLDDE